MQQQGTLGMVGTTFRRAGQVGLAYYTLAEEAVKTLHAALGCQESVYLATCNRVELFFVAPAGCDVAEVRRRFFAYFAGLRGATAPPPFADARALTAFAEDGAAERLFVVACALDSMVPGEAQILGQVKAALQRAKAQQTAGPALGALFAQAFAVAKRVREQTTLGRGRTSMVSLASELLQERLGQQAAAPAAATAATAATAAAEPPRTLVLVGAGAMAEQAARSFAGQSQVRLLVVNRTLAKAEALAARHGGAALALETFLAAPPPFAALLTSTASPTPLFDKAFFARLRAQPLPQAPPLLVDLSVHRDVDVAAAAAHGCALWDIDRLQERAQAHHAARRGQLAAGRQLVDEALAAYHRREAERSLSLALQAWRQHNARLLHTSLAGLRRKLAAAGPIDQEPLLQQWASQLVAGLMHAPTHGLRQLVQEHGPQAVAAFLAGGRLLAQPASTPAPMETKS